MIQTLSRPTLSKAPATLPTLELPTRLNGFFEPGPLFYALYGGRGSAKSWSIAGYLIYRALQGRERILCGREFQTSIDDSVKALLEATIERLGFQDYFRITDRSITSANGSRFIFKGLRHNIASIKSLEGITILWIEEAHVISRTSLDTILPTVRAGGSICIFSMNPQQPTDPVFEDFIAPKIPRPDVRALEVNFYHNPWFSEMMRRQMLAMRASNFGMFRHVWLGKFLVDDDARIFKNVVVEAFEAPENADFLYGADFGFAKDPATILRSYMSPDQTTIYVDYQFAEYHLQLDKYPTMYDRVPGIKSGVVIGDSANPQTIDYCNGLGYSMSGARKGKDSVRDGIRFLQSKVIKVHPRCKDLIAESFAYVFKRHPVTNRVLPEPEDANNHCWDALRYAYEDLWMPAEFSVTVID